MPTCSRAVRPVALPSIIFAAMFAAMFASGCRVDQEAARTSGPTEILWDTYGVPHIFAANDEELLYAWGWAQMENHGDLILRLYGRARGRAAEYWGEDYLDNDRWVHTVGIPARASEWVDAVEPEFASLYEAFVAGMNGYAEAHADRLGEDVKMVLPVQAEDPMAHLLAAIHYTFIVSPGAVQAASRAWGQMAERTGSGVTIAAPDGRVDLTAPEPVAGSNAWAIAPSRTESNHALLLANPHLPWSDLFVWMEGQLTSPSIDAYGATLVGLPLPAIAFNDRLGWTHTVNTFDGADLYELSLEADGYRWDETVREFETRTVDIRIKTEEGSVRVEPLTIRESVHGPVVSEQAGRALALRVVGLDQPNLWGQYWDMLKAQNLVEFESALSRLQMPMFTVMYADADGHIMHVFGGRTPVRPAGDWNWAGVVPGDRSETLWTEEHAYANLPRVVDPESGWLQNANDPPWTTTFPRALDPEAFPSYMAPRGMAFRPQRSATMLIEDESISFEEMLEYKHSTRMGLADRLLDELIPAARAAGGDAARAADVLEAWDRETDADSRGAVLFRAWWTEHAQRLGPAGTFATSWDPAEPTQTPDGLADSDAAAEDLASAARDIESRFGSLDVPWGDVNRLRRDDVDLPANGASGAYGVFRVTGYRDADDGKRVAVQGDSYVAVIEFGPTVRARSLLGYGNASQPGSPHRTDQMRLYSDKSLRPVWRTKAEVRANLRNSEAIRPQP